MKSISFDSMSICQGGKKELSDDCIKALIAEGLSYSLLFTVSSVLTGGLAIAGLAISAVIMGIACS